MRRDRYDDHGLLLCCFIITTTTTTTIIIIIHMDVLLSFPAAADAGTHPALQSIIYIYIYMYSYNIKYELHIIIVNV